MKTNRKYLHIIITIIFLFSSVTACAKEKSKETKAGPGSDTPAHTRIAELMASINIRHFTQPTVAPDFQLPSVKGERVSLNQYRGKVVLLSFWTTW
ncbi:MAG: hypothetical protein C4560_02370 [Nitrospiraceae bacterium]|nr:MAG: hypothetical protein C4560_02370 [Nitrospiraceae bacterium]